MRGGRSSGTDIGVSVALQGDGRPRTATLLATTAYMLLAVVVGPTLYCNAASGPLTQFLFSGPSRPYFICASSALTVEAGEAGGPTKASLVRSMRERER